MMIELGERQQAFVNAQIASGQFTNEADVINAALDDMALAFDSEDDYDLPALREAVLAGIRSGVAEGDVIARVRQRAGLPAKAH
jgi:putative addiction module CopG family antidote